jgi:hypothetical protein
VFLSINDVSVTEGGTAQFTLSLTNPNSCGVTVDYQIVDGTATTANNDYVVASGTLNIGAGTSLPLNVQTIADTKFEGNETFFVNLTNAVNATISDNQGQGTINNDDAVPSMSIGPVNVNEGDVGTINEVFTVTLSNTTDQTVTVAYQTADAFATLANNDYQFASGTLTIPPKTLTGTITVLVNGDTKFEANETYTVNLSSPVNATIASGQGFGIISNDDFQPTVSIADVKVIEGNAGTVDAVLKVSLTNASYQVITVGYTTVDGNSSTPATTANSDYIAASGVLTFQPKETSQTITVQVVGDNKYEPDQDFAVLLFSPVGVTMGDGSATVTISNDDALPVISIGDAKVMEGDAGTVEAVFKVSLDRESDNPVQVGFQVNDGTATMAIDYNPSINTVNFPPKTTSQTVTVLVYGDTQYESDETFYLVMNLPVGAIPGDGVGVGTISNDDPAPSISIDDVNMVEGDFGTTSMVFTVSLSGTSGDKITVDYQTLDGSATLANNDYVMTSGTLSIPAMTSSATITVPVNGDPTNEGNETFTVNLSNAVGATIADGQGVGTIVNDDAPPTISISQTVNVDEGNGGITNAVFSVTMTNPSDQKVTVDYTTSDGSATLANSDYQPATGTLSFPAKGVLKAEITVQVNGDTKFEGDETFNVVLSNPSGGASLGDAVGVGTIRNDDNQPVITITDVKVIEGNVGTVQAVFSVLLSNTTDQKVSIVYGTSDGSATGGEDYVPANGTLSIPPKTSFSEIHVLVNGDVTFEPNETFFVNLSAASNATIGDAQAVGTISNDDASFSQISIGDASGLEDGGPLAFSISLAVPNGSPISVNYSTADGSATLANGDYVAASGTVTFAPSETKKTITVPVNADTKNEPNEDFTVVLSGNTGPSSILDGSGTGTIVNDDGTISQISIGDASGLENGGPLTFSISLDVASGFPISVNYSTANGSADGTDYVPAMGSVTFAPKEIKKTITIQLVADCGVEPDELFTVNLFGNNGPSTIADGSGTGTILNDDVAVSPVSGLTAVQQTTGNDGDGTTKIKLTWGGGGGATSIEVWRAGFGSYPEYDDAGGSAPATPGSYPPPSPWVLTTVTASGQSDETTARDFYYYVAYAKDACGGASAVSNQTGGTLNYHLGDWHDGITNCQGNNIVNTSDLSFLGAHYGITLSHSSDPFSCLDVGPTTTATTAGRPTTDDRVQFEDLVIMSINYLSVSVAPGTLPEVAKAVSDEVRLSVPATPAVGQTFTVGVDLSGAGDIQALSLLLNFDRNVVEQVSVAAGELLKQQASPGVALSSEPGDVDVAVLGTANGGMAGTGRIAEVTFRVKAAGDAGISIQHLEARNGSNQTIPLAVTKTVSLPVGKTALGSAFPNPFQQSTAIQLALEAGGMVKLGVFDVAGRQVRNLINGYQVAGQRMVSWDGRNDAGMQLAAGMYVIKLETSGVVTSRRVAVVK